MHVDLMGLDVLEADFVLTTAGTHDVSIEEVPVSEGAIAGDGVSLTRVHVDDARFSVQLIPHTLAVTTLGRRRAGDTVNLDTDILAKYVVRQLAAAGNDLPIQPHS